MSGCSAKRESYHHGNLRAEAIEFALRLLAQQPKAPFSLRAVAVAAGVAHRAIAAQFGDRAGLEAAVAARGFELLCDGIAASADATGFITAYTRFALDQPALYDLMMQQGYGAFETVPELRAAADRTIAIALSRLAGSAIDPIEARRAVMRLWMLVHGGIALHRAGVLLDRNDAAFVQELLAIAGLADSEPGAAQELWNEKE